MGKTLIDKIKNRVAGGVLLGALTFGSLGALTGCGYLDKYLEKNLLEKESPYKTGRLEGFRNGPYKDCIYVGEYLVGPNGRGPYGRGTMFDKEGNVLRDGYWSFSGRGFIPVDEDPLEGMRQAKR